MLPSKCPTKPVTIRVEIDKAFFAVFLEVDLISRTGLRDEDDHM